MKYLIGPREEKWETVAKALSTPDSLVCLWLFLWGSFAQTSAEVSPLAQLQVLVRHVGNVLAGFMSVVGQGLWGWQHCASSHSPLETPRQGDYGVLLTQTNCLKCEVRANSAVGFPFWISVVVSSALWNPGWFHSTKCLTDSHWNWSNSGPLLCISFLLIFWI